MNPTKLTHEEVLVVDKITYEAKITDFELRNTPSGRQYFWDGENSEKLTIKDGLQFICDAACYGFDFALEFGLTQQEIDTWNAMIDRFGLSDEFKAEDFKEREILRAKESTRKQTMKKLNITKEQFEKSRYFKNKYGKLEYVSESGKMFKTSKGKLLKFKEANGSFADESTLDMAEEIFTALRRANKNRWNLGFSQSRAEVTIEDIQTNDCFTIKVVKDKQFESTKKSVKGSIDRGDWMDENLFDLIKQLYDVANKAKIELKDEDLFTKLMEIANELTDLRLGGIMDRLGYSKH